MIAEVHEQTIFCPNEKAAVVLAVVSTVVQLRKHFYCDMSQRIFSKEAKRYARCRSISSFFVCPKSFFIPVEKSRNFGNQLIKESETYISEVAVIMGEEHSTVSSITSSSCHIFLNIILSFIVKPSFSLRLKFEIISYFQGSIIDPRSRKERKNKTAKLRARRSGSQS